MSMEPTDNEPRKTGITSTTQGGFASHFAATVQKNMILKSRNKCSCCMETVLPWFVILGVMGIWAAIEIEHESATSFYPPSDTVGNTTVVQSNVTDPFVPLRKALCTKAPLKIPGVADCAMIAQYASMQSNMTAADMLGKFPCMSGIPTLPDGQLCIMGNPMKAFSSFFMMFEPRFIPTFDEIVLMQWVAAGMVGLDGEAGGSLATLLRQGQLHFIEGSNARHVITQLRAEPTSTLIDYVLGDYFLTMKDADTYLYDATTTGYHWGVVDIPSFDATNYTVSIRLNRSSVPDTDAVQGRTLNGLWGAGTHAYMASGFLSLQDAIDRVYIKTRTSQPQPPRIVLVPMPYAGFPNNIFLLFAAGMIIFFFVFAYLYPVSQMVKSIVEEKETRIRETMMIMGLGTGSFYLSWAAVYSMQQFISALLIAISIKITMAPQVDFFIAFFLFFLFGLSVVSLSMIISSFFSKSNVAAMVSPIIFFMLCVPAFIGGLTEAQTVAISLISPAAFTVGVNLLFSHELLTGMGSQQFFEPKDHPNMGVMFIMLIFDVLWYFFLTLYLDAVLPSEWGTQKHPLFPIFAIIDCLKEATGGDDGTGNDGKDENGVFEVIERPAPPTVQLKGLRKEFASNEGTFVAVNDLTLDFYDSEITVVVGHNGAGKTTAINCMTGMLEMSGGDCIVYGHSARTDLHGVRQEIGWCPQHNVLWMNMTCMEHLHFYGKLKGLSWEETNANALDMLGSVDLMDKADIHAGNLSGGQKRKLSVAIAFVGGNRMVFLDEPTAGMDVGARRHTWDLIKRMSVGRTVILTTHFMDEADLLGHTVSIMSKGTLKCSGSPFFLKQKLGAGYTLTMNCKVDADHEQLIGLVASHVPAASVVTSTGAELTLRLPTESVSSFPTLLEALENCASVIGFGISVTTLEEIFLRIGQMEEMHDVNVTAPNTPAPGVAVEMSNKKNKANDFDAAAAAAEPQMWAPEELSREAFALSQLGPLMAKRFHNSKRDTRTIILQCVLPVVCVIAAMLLGLIEVQEDGLMVIRADSYPTAEIALSNCPANFQQYAQPGSDPTVVDPAMLTGYELNQHLNATMKQHKVDRAVAIQCLDASIHPVPTNVPNGGSELITAAVLFGNQSYYHSGPQSLQDYNSMYVRNTTSKAAPTWEISSFPMFRNRDQIDNFQARLTFSIALFILLPFCFIPSTFISWPVKEREVHAKHLQIVSGMNYVVYWLSNFLFDVVSFFVTAVLVIIVFLCFTSEEYVGTWDNFGAIFTAIMLYGISSISMMYAASFAFDSHATAQNIAMLVCFVTGFMAVLAIFILQIFDSTKEYADAVIWVLRLIPAFDVGDCILRLAVRDPDETTAWDDDITGWNMVYMACEVPFFLIITMILDHPSRRMRQESLLGEQGMAPEVPEREDHDVTAERNAVEAGRAGDLVTVKNLRKAYPVPTGTKVAVKNLSFGVHEGEVFAFLGTNGAGKTTTISVLCGETIPTRGQGSVVGMDVVTQALDARRVIGYCPQFDALHDLLTPVEHLYLYCGLRGIPSASRFAVVERLITMCDLEFNRDKVSQSLSGGNKRKLSVAISLVGGPKVVFLDEPSAGMDVGARHLMWAVIEKVAKQCCVVLTTHHLEEVEALADRMAIMVDGEMKCIGTLQHLKNKFGSGFEMTVKVGTEEQVAPVQTFLAGIPGATLEECRSKKMTYALPQSTVLSVLFRTIEDAKAFYGIVDYSICQSSVEQVFLRIGAGAESDE